MGSVEIEGKKAFIRTADNDEKIVEFDTEREAVIFGSAVEVITHQALAVRPGEDATLAFRTTAQAQVSSAHLDVFRSIIGVDVLNIFGKDNVFVRRCTKGGTR